eukprot:3035815-Pyramimonas_sp.AAC.1
MLPRLQRAKWEPENFPEWIDDRGIEISLLYTSPSLVKPLLREATQRQHERDMARSVGMHGGTVRACAELVCTCVCRAKKYSA